MDALMGIAYALEMEESDVREIVKRRARSSFPGSRGGRSEPDTARKR